MSLGKVVTIMGKLQSSLLVLCKFFYVIYYIALHYIVQMLSIIYLIFFASINLFDLIFSIFLPLQFQLVYCA